MKNESERSEFTLDALFGGAIQFRQMRRGHRIGTDTVLLAALAAGMEGRRVVDLGAGVGGVGLTLLVRGSAERAVLVEPDPGLAALAGENARLNGLSDRIEIVEATVWDVKHRAGPMPPGQADLVVCNPPFHDSQRHRPSPDDMRREAHTASLQGLHDWVAAASLLMKTGGRLAIIYRADGLQPLLQLLGTAFGGVTVMPVYGKAGAVAARILVTAKLASKTPLQIMPGLVLHEADGRFTPQAEALHRGDFTALQNANGAP